MLRLIINIGSNLKVGVLSLIIISNFAKKRGWGGGGLSSPFPVYVYVDRNWPSGPQYKFKKIESLQRFGWTEVRTKADSRNSEKFSPLTNE